MPSRLSNAIAILFLLATARSSDAQCADSAGVTLRMDYTAAEALIAALERDALSEADVDRLLRVPGVAAMVRNVTRFFPEYGIPEFGREIATFARTKSGGVSRQYFQLQDAWSTRPQVRKLLSSLRSDERGIICRTVAELGRYRPSSGPLQITVYFVVGGVSDGFVFDDDPRPRFYANLARAEGDPAGVVANLAHEAYHVLQKAAQRRAGLARYADSTEVMPGPERLLAVLLAEGTANYAVDPTRSTTAGPQLDSARARYRRNGHPGRIRDNFALFDRALAELRQGRTDWEDVYERGFSGTNDARFYFVGYEMARAIDRHCGAGCIGAQFERPPVEFFRQYIQLYRRDPSIPGRFAAETERVLMALGPIPLERGATFPAAAWMVGVAAAVAALALVRVRRKA